jgi:hypothetical protein
MIVMVEHLQQKAMIAVAVEELHAGPILVVQELDIVHPLALLSLASSHCQAAVAAPESQAALSYALQL